jgi:hypothetical protein
MKMTWTWADKRAEALELFLGKTLPDFIMNHEFHLRGNGSNGHYVGDRVSWPCLFGFSTPDKFTLNALIVSLTLFRLPWMHSIAIHRISFSLSLSPSLFLLL